MSLIRNVDPENMIVYLTGEVNDDMYKDLVFGLTTLINRPAKRKAITISINSEGGALYSALAMYDFIKFSSTKKLPIHTLAIGAVMSAANIIHQAGAKRYMLKNTYLMTHYGEEVNVSTGQAKHNMELFTKMKSIVGKRVNVSKRTVNSWFKSETFFSSTQAIRYNLVDEIIE